MININKKDYDEYIEKSLDEAEEETNNPNTKYLTHEEVFDSIRMKLDS